MFSKLLKRFISWLYRLLEEEGKRVEAERIQVEEFERERASLEAVAATLRIKQERQSRCTHLKGGGGPRISRDYAISVHTFPDDRKVTKCLICGKEWSKELGNWEQAEEMRQLTSNMPSASERVFTVTNREAPAEEHAKQWDPEEEPMSPFISKSLWDKIVSWRPEKSRKRKK